LERKTKFQGESTIGLWVWWHTPVIPALGRLGQEDRKFKASLWKVSKTLSLKQNRRKKGGESGLDGGVLA
jgi:hypothetical protein